MVNVFNESQGQTKIYYHLLHIFKLNKGISFIEVIQSLYSSESLCYDNKRSGFVYLKKDNTI